MNKPLLVYQAPVFTRSGYGDHARDILRSLFKMDKYDIKVVPTRWGNTPQNQIKPDSEFGIKVFSNIITKLERKPDIFMQMSVANEFEPKGNYNIGITAGVETTIIPKEFIDGSNKMDLIIVPSTFTQRVMLQTAYQEKNNQTGVIVGEYRITKPVEVLFEGVDLERYLPSDSKVDILDGILETDFNFLYVGHWLKGSIGQDRKDVGMVIKTFATVFKYLPKDKRPGLILKTSHAGFSVIDRENTRDKIEAIIKDLGDDLPKIYLLHGDLEDSEMSELYNHPKVKAMVSFTKGEGYGRPLAEFALTGKPIMVSGWSGHVDFLPKEHTVFLEGELTDVHESAADKFILKNAKWFTVNYSDAANKMYKVFNEYETYLSQSAGLKTNIETNFSLTKMDDVFVEMMSKYVKALPQQKPFNLPKLNKNKMQLPKLNKVIDANEITTKFTNTYKSNGWGSSESASGHGSSLTYSENFKNSLLEIIGKYNIQNIFDCSCGDWNWMKEISTQLPNYTGNDVVKELIDINNKKFGNEKTKFISGDMLSELKKYDDNEIDLLICRHTFEHLPTEYVLDSISEIIRVSKYAIITHIDSVSINTNINMDGRAYRPINLQCEPYLNILGEPLATFFDSIGEPTGTGTFGNLYKQN